MAVVDALVSKVLDMLFSTIGKEIEQEVRLVVGIKKQVKMLTTNLQSIQVVLVDAERRQWKEASVQLWVDRLKDVSYDIEDVLDEWSFAIMKSQRERDDFASKPKRKVWSFILPPCFYFREVGFRRDIAVKITELNERFDVISSEKEKYGFLSLEINNEQVTRFVTTSIVDISEVKGRKADREKLIKLLLAKDSEKPKLHPISIVGMGGIGKTTLAKLVYNDGRVKTHFDKRIWVCVSDPFDEIRIAKEILEYLRGSTTNLVSLPNIMESIQQSIEGKRVLLVLDDVWNEDPRKWKPLEDCLKSSSIGSRVLVTTRNENVGRIMGCLESNILRVGLLSVGESWELFCMIALSRRSSNERESLEVIGREIVKRCKGLPLAIRAIASLLQFKSSMMEWKSVLNSELWDLEEVQRDITGPLWLSYYDLPSPLKQCFSYYAVFPKDYVMEKSELIWLWMAQGYIKGTQSRDVETVGDECFQNLKTRSLFQGVVVESDIFGPVKFGCKMHDIVHDFAQLLVKKECLSIEVNDDSEAINLDDSLGNLLHHLSISFKLKVQCLDSFYNLKKLRSLIVSSSMQLSSSKAFGLDLKRIFNEFTVLRSLRLHRCGIAEVPPNINRLIHLRELDLSGNLDLVELPNTTWELYNLQILNLISTRMRSVKGIGRLNNLRHLEYPISDSLLPKEMVRLSSLRSLNWVKIDVDKEEAFSLKHLKNFNQLGGSLAISLSKHGDGYVEDAKQAHLKDNKHITELKLWLDDKETDQRRKRLDEELVEALNVPQNLEILRIHRYMSIRTPKWSDSLTFVKKVHLTEWKNCEYLPPLGKLPCLQNLILWSFYSVKKVGAEFLGMDETRLSLSSTIVPSFPKLRSLDFSHFGNWEEWCDVDGDIDEEMPIMPSLAYLEIKFCSKLKSLPNFILKRRPSINLKIPPSLAKSLNIE